MSFIYELHCKMCNKVLRYVADMDDEFDIIVDVEPCSGCIKVLADRSTSLKAVDIESEKHDSPS